MGNCPRRHSDDRSLFGWLFHRDPEGWTPLHAAVSSGDALAVSKILAKRDVDINCATAVSVNHRLEPISTRCIYTTKELSSGWVDADASGNLAKPWNYRERIATRRETGLCAIHWGVFRTRSSLSVDDLSSPSRYSCTFILAASSGWHFYIFTRPPSWHRRGSLQNSERKPQRGPGVVDTIVVGAPQLNLLPQPARADYRSRSELEISSFSAAYIRVDTPIPLNDSHVQGGLMPVLTSKHAERLCARLCCKRSVSTIATHSHRRLSPPHERSQRQQHLRSDGHGLAALELLQ